MHITLASVTYCFKIKHFVVLRQNKNTVMLQSVIAFELYFLVRDSIIYAIAHYMLSPVRLSVCLSVTRVDQSKRVEDRIMQLSPQSSPMTLVSSWLISPRNSEGNIGSGCAK